MAVYADFECLAHGHFETKWSGKVVPKCPKGCSSTLVKHVYLQPVGFVSARTRTSDRLVKEMAAQQNLSDLSTSPSRPGGSVMDRLRKKHGAHLHESQIPRAVDAKEYMGALTHKSNEMTNIGLGHKYNAAEWKKDAETGKVKHNGGEHIQDFRPAATVERVKEKLT